MTLVLFEGSVPQVVPRVPAGQARREHVLRDLIHEHPSVLPVHDLDPGYGTLISVTRELSIPGVGFVDVLLVDSVGRLVIVECKLWRNPQARREVVGQILDYARELSRFSFDDLQRQISIATGRRGNVLYELAREAGSTLQEAEFVDRVSRDLAAGRFLLLVVGDGITEGTQRIGEYLRAQPGLAFEFGLVEIAEYQVSANDGSMRRILQPRVLARTAVIERHVIRSDVPGVIIQQAAPESHAPARPASGDAGDVWRRFAEAFVAEVKFDDPGQPPPRSGGLGWIRIPLPGPWYINLYRSSGSGEIGAQVRFPGAQGAEAYAMLEQDRAAIDAEFTGNDLTPPRWIETDVPQLELRTPSPRPWDEPRETEQRAWMASVANQLVNSLRPRLHKLQVG